MWISWFWISVQVTVNCYNFLKLCKHELIKFDWFNPNSTNIKLIIFPNFSWQPSHWWISFQSKQIYTSYQHYYINILEEIGFLFFNQQRQREGEKRKIAKRRRNLYIYRWLILMLFFCSGGQICSKVIVQHNLLVQVCSFPIMIKSVFLFVSNLIFHHTSNVVDNDFGVHYFSYNPSPTFLISFPSHLHTLFFPC